MPIGADVLVGLISSIVFEGLKRPFKGVADAIARRKHISRALTQSDPDIKRTNTAFTDLTSIIAHAHDSFNDQIADFLLEIERSSIPDALKQFVLCGQDASAAFPAFAMIYNAHAPLPFSAERMFEAIVEAIKQRIEQSISDKTLFDALKAQGNDLSDKITALQLALKNATHYDALTADQFADALLKTAKGIENSNRFVNVETNQGTKKIVIKKIVIPARLLSVPDVNAIPMPNRDAKADRTEVTSYLAFRRSFNRAVILGDPGGGKSTLTQLICFDLSRSIILEAATPRHKIFDAQDFRLPLRIIVRTLDKRQQRDSSYNLFDYVVDELKLYFENDVVSTVRFIRQLMITGRAALLFDGLDEILDLGSRRSMVEQIEQFTNLYAACPAIITSRIVGYRDAPLSDDFEISMLSRFNRDEVLNFSTQFISAVTNCRKSAAKLLASSFVQQTESSAADLRENPLLLGLMVYIFNFRGEVPNNRPEIYKECSLLMFEKWDQRRDIGPNLPKDFDLLDLFGFLASNIFGDADAEDGVTEDWLTGRLRSFFMSWYQDHSKAVTSAKELVEFITGRAWVMCEVGPGIYKFTHRTFLEYFFARYIEEVAASIEFLLLTTLRSRIFAAEWDVVSHLALQIATFRSGPKSEQAVAALLKLGDGLVVSPEEELNYLTFLAKTMEYLTLPDRLICYIASHIFDRCVVIGSTHSIDSIEVFHDFIESTQRRSSLVESHLCDLAFPILSGPSSPQRTFVLYLTGAQFTGFKPRRRRAPIHYEQFVWLVFDKVRRACQPDQFLRAQNDADEAKDYIYVYEDNLLELYKLHRSLLLVNDKATALVPAQIGALPYYILSDAISYCFKKRFRFRVDMCGSRIAAQSIMKMIASDLLPLWKKDHFESTHPNLFSLAGDQYIYQILAFLSELEHVDFVSVRNKALRAECLFVFCALSLVNQLRRGSRVPNSVQPAAQKIWDFYDGLSEFTSGTDEAVYVAESRTMIAKLLRKV